MPISDKLIDQLLDGCNSPDDILGEAGLLKQLTKKVAERALSAGNNILVMPNMLPRVRTRAIPVTENPVKRSVPFMVRLTWTCRVIATAALSQSWLKRATSSFMDSMIESFHSMPEV